MAIFCRIRVRFCVLCSRACRMAETGPSGDAVGFPHASGMLTDMDHPIRFAVGALLALAAAAVLVWSIGKPPEWDPRFFGLRPGGLGGRDRVRIYALVALVAGVVVAIYFGLVVR